jgi:hypothetical protein
MVNDMTGIDPRMLADEVWEEHRLYQAIDLSFAVANKRQNFVWHVSWMVSHSSGTGVRPDHRSFGHFDSLSHCGI